MIKKLLLSLLVILPSLVAPGVAQERKPYCDAYPTVNNNLVIAGFLPVYMSADDEFKTGTRIYINAEQKAIAVIIVDLTEGTTPKACLATIQGNLSVRKDVLEHLHNKLIGEKS